MFILRLKAEILDNTCWYHRRLVTSRVTTQNPFRDTRSCPFVVTVGTGCVPLLWTSQRLYLPARSGKRPQRFSSSPKAWGGCRHHAHYDYELAKSYTHRPAVLLTNGPLPCGLAVSGVECSSAVLCSCDFGAGDHAMVLESSKEASMELLKIALSCWASRLLAGVGEVSACCKIPRRALGKVTLPVHRITFAVCRSEATLLQRVCEACSLLC